MGRTGEVLYAFVPVLLLILGGYLGQRSGRIDAGLRSGLERIAYHVFLPALLFQNLASSAVPGAAVLPLLLLTASSILLTTFAMLAWCCHAAVPAAEVGPHVMASMRFNNFLGFSLLLPLFGPIGLAAGAMVSTFAVIVANTVSVVVLLTFAGRNRPSLRQLGVELARNPLIQASAAGLAWKASSLDLFAPVERTLAMLGQAGIVCGLIVVGAALALAPSALPRRAALASTAFTKFLVLPAWPTARPGCSAWIRSSRRRSPCSSPCPPTPPPTSWRGSWVAMPS
ncbi:AEC family transporter [Geminicoccus flavidas]|uniref:AEC family transporter n=1 Tax=Geminicoccus flavidas TaxID=2506407 RepID=UPI00135AB7E0|nr:AEC family transporter [Geminicoccus flavidas]